MLEFCVNGFRWKYLSAHKYHSSFPTSKNIYDSIIARLQIEVFENRLPFLYSLLQYIVTSRPVLLLCLQPLCQKEHNYLFVWFLFRGGLREALIWFWWMVKLSIFFNLWGFFSLSLLCVYLVYGQLARTMSNWCTHDVSMTYVYCAFNSYADDEQHAVNVRVTQGTNEISLRL